MEEWKGKHKGEVRAERVRQISQQGWSTRGEETEPYPHCPKAQTPGWLSVLHSSVA